VQRARSVFSSDWAGEADRRARRLFGDLVGKADVSEVAYLFGEDLIPPLLYESVVEMP
jgi:hypothetical protein